MIVYSHIWVQEEIIQMKRMCLTRHQNLYDLLDSIDEEQTSWQDITDITDEKYNATSEEKRIMIFSIQLTKIWPI